MAAASGDITICSREDGSGTRGAFIELFGIEEKRRKMENKVDNTTESSKRSQNSTSVMLKHSSTGRKCKSDMYLLVLWMTV